MRALVMMQIFGASLMRWLQWSRLLGFGSVFLFWAVVLHVLPPTWNIWLLLLCYAAAALAGWGAIWWIIRRFPKSELQLKGLERRSAFLFAAVFALLAALRDLWMLNEFYFFAHSDTFLYTELGVHFFDRTFNSPYALARTPLYPFFLWLLNGSGYSGIVQGTAGAADFTRVAVMQITLAAIAFGALIYVLLRRDRALGVIAALLLLTDIVWGSLNRWIFTESITLSLALLSLALAIHQLSRGVPLRWWQLLLTGIFYAITLTIRPSNVILILPILCAYIWCFRSFGWQRAILQPVWLSLGFVFIIVSIMFYNLWRYDQFVFVGLTGWSSGGILYGYQLFSPENGPASEQLHQRLIACGQPESYDEINVDNVMVKFYERLIWVCIDHNTELEAAFRLQGQALTEAIRARPTVFLETVLRESAVSFAYPVRQTFSYTVDFTCAFIFIFNDYFVVRPPLPFSLENPLYKAFLSWTTPIAQPYFLLSPDGELPAWRDPNFYSPLVQSTTPQPYPAAAAALMLMGWVFLTARGLCRWCSLAAIVWILYTILTNNAFSTTEIVGLRYISALSPWYMLLAAAGYLTLWRSITKN
jgi:hypothetical protein